MVAAGGTERRTHIDWLRGLAILIMVEAHVVDSWTRAADRSSLAFGWASILGGAAAPSFLFLAGIGTALALVTKRARAGSEQAAAGAIERRGWQIFGFAFLFRLQSIVLNPGAPLSGLLKVDILNIMGPAIAVSARLLGRVRGQASRLAWLAVVVAGVVFLTPVVRTTPWLAWLPAPVEWYFRPRAGGGGFALFPWAGFVFAGTFVGLLIAPARQAGADLRFHAALLAAGVALAVGSYQASYLPSFYRESNFWTTSPAFFFMRIGLLLAAVALARFWAFRPRLTPIGRFGAMERFGRSSLFVYWIHVEMVYGWFSRPLHRALSLGQVAAAYALFAAALFGLVVVKQSVVSRRRVRGANSTSVGVRSGTG